MTEMQRPGSAGLQKLRQVRRKAIDASEGARIELSPLEPGQPLPLVVRPAVEGVDLNHVARSQRELLEEKLLDHGGLLFRGFGLSSTEDLEAFIRSLSGELLEYRDRVQPRSAQGNRIYSSTEYPPDQTIELHNESAYAYTWPGKIFFLSLVVAEEGGETPIADCRRIYERVDREIQEMFRRKGVLYVRNFGDGLGITWQEAFQTEDRAEMERFCRATGIELEWRAGGRLRTRARRPAVIEHPASGATVWFNTAISAHSTTLDPSVRETLVSEFGEEGLPKNVFFGDGSPIEPEILDAVRHAYREETVLFPWREGDVLLLDNMLAAHGRRPYRGARRTVVGMSEPVSVSDVGSWTEA